MESLQPLSSDQRPTQSKPRHVERRGMYIVGYGPGGMGRGAAILKAKSCWHGYCHQTLKRKSCASFKESASLCVALATEAMYQQSKPDLLTAKIKRKIMWSKRACLDPRGMH